MKPRILPSLRRALLTIFASAMLLSVADAQISRHAIGIRAGVAGSYESPELSYQARMGQTTRLELDLGFISTGTDRIYLATMFHWSRNIFGPFNWFAGPGVSIAFLQNNAGFAVGGQLGIEMNLSTINIPLQFSLDARPMYGAYRPYDSYALALRYVW